MDGTLSPEFALCLLYSDGSIKNGSALAGGRYRLNPCKGFCMHWIPSKNPEEDYEIQTAYYMQKWREHTSSIMEPMAEALMKERMQALSDYNERATTYFNYCFDRVPDAEKKMLLEKALETPLPG